MKNNYLFRDPHFTLRQALLSLSVIFGATAFSVGLSLLFVSRGIDSTTAFWVAFVSVLPAIVWIHIAWYRNEQQPEIVLLRRGQATLREATALRRKLRSDISQYRALYRDVVNLRVQTIRTLKKAQRVGRSDVVQDVTRIIERSDQLIQEVGALVQRVEETDRRLEIGQRNLQKSATDLQEAQRYVRSEGRSITKIAAAQHKAWVKLQRDANRVLN